MELKVQRDTNVTICMSGEEASALLALLLTPTRGVLPIADELFDALRAEEVEVDAFAYNKVDAHLADVYGEHE